ncbi:MAG: hypothetical protein JWQ59_1301 [Cryobacterium sp.]|nr:hypothetical protein [Cryobacterium sp.]
MKRLLRRILSGVIVASAGLAMLVAVPQSAAALSASDFDPGYIVSDGVFRNSSTMNDGQIQAFLQAAVPNCSSTATAPCLKDYTTPTTSRPAASGGQCGSYEGAASERASTVIGKVARACGVNPQAIIVLLQKEQGLVTSTSPTPGRYRIATGYGCPDTAACDAQFYGFYNQVYKAAWQLREYMIHPTSWRYRVGAVAIQYNPNAGCGAPVVNIRNAATAALYNYTPYQPNRAALANLGGEGDACSAYGNRNFWVYFSNWFGSPIGLVNPVGHVDEVTAQPGYLHVRGWALDPDTDGSIAVHVYLNGVPAPFEADSYRPDVGNALSTGPNHGFDVRVPIATTGQQQVCVYGINEGPGANALISCTLIDPFSGSPVGYVDSVSSLGGAITVNGWALDPDVADPISVDLGSEGTLIANSSRPDVARAAPGYGDLHGLSSTYPASVGVHSFCAVARNVGLGSDTPLGCFTVEVLGPNAIGSLDDVAVTAGTVAVRGWAIDPTTRASIPVHVYVDAAANAITADASRIDVGRAYPSYGPQHGFVKSLAVSPGRHQVCAYAIKADGVGGNTNLGCRTVTVP